MTHEYIAWQTELVRSLVPEQLCHPALQLVDRRILEVLLVAHLCGGHRSEHRPGRLRRSPRVTRIVLIRHGQALSFVEQTVAGHACKGLSDHGRSQAALLRDRLVRTGELRGANVFYASLMRRAHETAEIIAPGVGDGRLDIRQDCGLCEQHPGDADGILWSEYDERFGSIDTLGAPDRSKVAAPGSEVRSSSRISPT